MYEGMDRKDILIVLMYLLAGLGLQRVCTYNERLLSLEQSDMLQVTEQTTILVLLTHPTECGLGPIMMSLKGWICNLEWGCTSL